MNYFGLDKCDDIEIIDYCVDSIIRIVVKEITDDKHILTFRIRVVGENHMIQLKINHHIPQIVSLHFLLFKSYEGRNAIERVGKYDHSLYPLHEIRKLKIKKLNLI